MPEIGLVPLVMKAQRALGESQSTRGFIGMPRICFPQCWRPRVTAKVASGRSRTFHLVTQLFACNRGLSFRMAQNLALSGQWSCCCALGCTSISVHYARGAAAGGGLLLTSLSLHIQQPHSAKSSVSTRAVPPRTNTLMLMSTYSCQSLTILPSYSRHNSTLQSPDSLTASLPHPQPSQRHSLPPTPWRCP